MLNNKKSDFISALKGYDLWSFLAWQDIKLRYRRSKIGPLWITLSMAIFCLSLGVVYSRLFNAEVNEYVPFLSLGFVVWGLMSGMLNEFPNVFVDNAPYIKDTRRMKHRGSQLLERSLSFLVWQHMFTSRKAKKFHFGSKPIWFI